MEQCTTNKPKRPRDDSLHHSPDSSKHLRPDPDSSHFQTNSDESPHSLQLGRVEPVLDSSEVNEIQDDLLNMLDEAENANPNVQVQGLDSVIKSFEEEILAHPGSDPNPDPVVEFKPNLGYLLEATDDELGLPPTVTPSGEEKGEPESEETGRVGPEVLDLTGFLGFEDDIGQFEGFGLTGYDVEDNGGGYVTIDGLFDYAEPTADILWRSESLQAM